MGEKVRATKADRVAARAEVFLVASLAAIEADTEAPVDEFEIACADDPELRELKNDYRQFLLGPYLGAQARKAAFVRKITSREAAIKDSFVPSDTPQEMEASIDLGEERPQPGAWSQTPTLRELIND